MKKSRLEKTLLEELSKTSNISIACERTGLSRQTVYRWMDEDEGFRKKVEKSIKLGIESISDLAESKLIGHIKSGSQRSIEYWLDNHKDTYMRPRPKDYWEKIKNSDRVNKIEVKVFTKREEVEEDEKNREKGIESNEGWIEERIQQKTT